MLLDLPLVQTVLICGAAYALWRYVRRASINSVLNNIPGPPSASFLTGNMNQFFGTQGWDFHKDITQNYGSVVKMYGMLNQPVLYVYDPKALYHIVVKDHHIYQEMHAVIVSNIMTLGSGLFATLGDHHRKQKKLLTPVFSITHMRHMLPIFYQVIGKLHVAIGTQVKDGPREVDVLNWMGRTALELIGRAGLGYSFDSLVGEDVHDEYGDAVKSFLPTVFSLSIERLFTPYVTSLGSPAFRRRLLDIIPHKTLHRLKSIVDTMADRATEIFNEKKSALLAGDDAAWQQVGNGKDIMSILMKANMNVSEEDRLPEDELIAQMSTLIFAAMDTTSNALARILHLLAEHQNVQDRLREEVVNARQGQDLSYDDLMQLPYLDAVCRETLRVHSPVRIIPREARKDMILPLSQPIRGRDGKMMHEIIVPKDTQLMVGVDGSNCNKALWGEDATEWKPERWLSPLPDAVTNAHVPGVYSLMSFNGGAKACIGFKFAELEMKAVLTTLLSSFSFELPKGRIVWNMSGVVYPTMDDDPKFSMMLKVSPLKNNAI